MSGQGLRLFVEAVLSMFVIINPIGNLPLLLGMTADLPAGERRRVLQLAGVVALGIIWGFAFGGAFLMLHVFHIGLPEFTFGGGLMLVVIGIRNIVLRPQYQAPAPAGVTPARLADEEMTLAVSPIAFPLLAGPGSIVTVMLIVNRSGVVFGALASAAAFVLILAVLRWGDVLLRVLGRVGALALGRVLQILIVSIGVHFIFQAVRDAFLAPKP